MASQDSKDSLDILQQMFNDVLVQTGKALRASRKDAAGDTNHVQASTQLRLPETMRTFHSALDDLETEIVRAKSVMQRDLTRLQANNTMAPPQPVDAQTKSPLVIDVESSPQRGGDDSTLNPASDTKPVAPFPDMGMDMSFGQSDDTTGFNLQGDQAATQEETKPESQPMAQPMASMAPEPSAADEAASDTKAKDANSGAAGVAGADSQNPEETFTNMEFTLAPADANVQLDTGTNDPAFDLSQFTNNDGGGDGLTLDSLLPQNPSDQVNTDPLAGGNMTSGNQDNTNGGPTELNDPAFDALTMDNMDFGAADGSDFDFSMGDGNTFDDLISSHEQNYDTGMEHGQADMDFFGLGQTDDT